MELNGPNRALALVHMTEDLTTALDGWGREKMLHGATKRRYDGIDATCRRSDATLATVQQHFATLQEFAPALAPFNRRVRQRLQEENEEKGQEEEKEEDGQEEEKGQAVAVENLDARKEWESERARVLARISGGREKMLHGATKRRHDEIDATLKTVKAQCATIRELRAGLRQFAFTRNEWENEYARLKNEHARLTAINLSLHHENLNQTCRCARQRRQQEDEKDEETEEKEELFQEEEKEELCQEEEKKEEEDEESENVQRKRADLLAQITDFDEATNRHKHLFSIDFTYNKYRADLRADLVAQLKPNAVVGSNPTPSYPSHAGFLPGFGPDQSFTGFRYP